MRILLLSWEYPPHMVGGLGKHVADLAPALGAQGIDVHIVTPNLRGGPDEEQPSPGLTIHRVSTLDVVHDPGSIVAFNQASNSYLERKGYELSAALGGFDLIHGHDWLVAYSSIAIKYALKIPLVATVHSMEHGRMQGDLSSEQSLAISGTEWRLTFEAWRVITVSHYMAQQVHDFFKVPYDKLDTIPNGVTLPQTPPMDANERATFRRIYARDYERIAYYVGRIVHEKGIQVLIDAAPLILRQMPAIKFVIAGTGAALEGLRSYARDRGVAEHFFFTGFIEDAVRDKLYQVADVAVFPSLYEPFGIVALEAMAFGCPVVVSDTGGLSEFVRPHETGILTAPGNPDSLAWGILHTLQNPTWAAVRAANALNEVKHVYNWERIAHATIATYKKALGDWNASDWGHEPD